MDPIQFDGLARLAAMGTSRRHLLRAGLGALVGTLVLERQVAARQECVPPFILCDGECVYSLTSNEHCGACGNACSQDVCVEGVCTSCEAIGLTTCADAVSSDRYCADLSTNINNCGTCGNRCTTGPCQGGTCLSTQECDPGLTECQGVCVDLQTDVAHCGDCATQCFGEAPPGQSDVGECVAGVCQVVCLAGYGRCAGGCADLSSDPNHCGVCFNACASGQCAGGTCVPSEGSPNDGITTLPNTGSGATESDRGVALTPAALVGAGVAVAAAGWRRLRRWEATG